MYYVSTNLIYHQPIGRERQRQAVFMQWLCNRGRDLKYLLIMTGALRRNSRKEEEGGFPSKLITNSYGRRVKFSSPLLRGSS